MKKVRMGSRLNVLLQDPFCFSIGIQRASVELGKPSGHLDGICKRGDAAAKGKIGY